MHTIIQRLDFDAAHRITEHESKCRNLHGHRYGAELYCTANELDHLGRVVDFSVVKRDVGGWIDHWLDHGTILHGGKDTKLAEFITAQGWKVYLLDSEPTAENLSALIYRKANERLAGQSVKVVKVRLYETPFCAAEYPSTEQQLFTINQHFEDMDPEKVSAAFRKFLTDAVEKRLAERAIDDSPTTPGTPEARKKSNPGFPKVGG